MMGVRAALLLSGLISTQLVNAVHLGDDPIATSPGLLSVEDDSVDTRKEESTKDGHGNDAHDAKVGASKPKVQKTTNKDGAEKKTIKKAKNGAEKKCEPDDQICWEEKRKEESEPDEETPDEGVQGKEDCVDCSKMTPASEETEEVDGKKFSNCNRLQDKQDDPSACLKHFNLGFWNGAWVKKQCEHGMPKMNKQECRPNKMCCDADTDEPESSSSSSSEDEETPDEGEQGKENCVDCSKMTPASEETEEVDGKKFSNCNRLQDKQDDPSACLKHFNFGFWNGAWVKKQCEHGMPKMNKQECRPNKMCCE